MTTICSFADWANNRRTSWHVNSSCQSFCCKNYLYQTFLEKFFHQHFPPRKKSSMVRCNALQQVFNMFIFIKIRVFCDIIVYYLANFLLLFRCYQTKRSAIFHLLITSFSRESKIDCRQHIFFLQISYNIFYDISLLNRLTTFKLFFLWFNFFIQRTTWS